MQKVELGYCKLFYSGHMTGRYIVAIILYVLQIPVTENVSWNISVRKAKDIQTVLPEHDPESTGDSAKQSLLVRSSKFCSNRSLSQTK